MFQEKTSVFPQSPHRPSLVYLFFAHVAGVHITGSNKCTPTLMQVVDVFCALLKDRVEKGHVSKPNYDAMRAQVGGFEEEVKGTLPRIPPLYPLRCVEGEEEVKGTLPRIPPLYPLRCV